MFRREYNSGLHNLHHDCAMMNELNWQALLFFYFFIVIKERERERVKLKIKIVRG